MYNVLVSRTFQKQYSNLPKKEQNHIKSALNYLIEDPYDPRPGADIKPLVGTDPLKYRLRVGDYRIVYCIEGKKVEVIEVFRRGRGYRK